MSRVRVLHVIPTVSRVDGGPVEALRRLHHALPRSGIESTVVSTDRRLEGRDDVRDIRALHLVKARSPDRLNFAPGVGMMIGSHAAATDVLHVHAVDAYTSTIAARAAVRGRIPLVLQPHGAFDEYHRAQSALLKRAYLRIFDRRHFERSAAVIVSSDREAAGVRAALGLPAVVIPLGVGTELFRVDDSAREDGHVLFLGRLTEKKCVDVAVRAFARSQVWKAGGRLTVAGPVDPRLGYDPIAIAREAGIAKHVDFVGAVGPSDRARLMGSAGQFVLPSKDESFGVSAAEAMAAGCVVIASGQVGLVPAAATAGAAVMANSEEEMAEQINALYANGQRSAEIRRRGRAYAAAEFNWAAVSDRFARVYRDVVATGQAGVQ